MFEVVLTLLAVEQLLNHRVYPRSVLAASCWIWKSWFLLRVFLTLERFSKQTFYIVDCYFGIYDRLALKGVALHIR